MAPIKIDKENKKKQILLAAMSVFGRKGITKTKMIDIAEEAGIGKGTIYEYYTSKDEIFKASYDLFLAQSEAMISERLSNIRDPLTKLTTWIDSWIESFAESGEMMHVLMDYWAEGIRTSHDATLLDVDKLYHDLRLRVMAILDEGIEKGVFKPVNTKITASILIGAMDGLALQWIMNHDIFGFEEAAEALKKSFLEGIRKK